MDKEEPNFNIWGEISEWVGAWTCKGRANIRKTTKKTSLRAVGEGRLATTSCRCRSEMHSEKHKVSDKDYSR